MIHYQLVLQIYNFNHLLVISKNKNIFISIIQTCLNIDFISRPVSQGFEHLFFEFLYQIAEGASQLFGNLELPCGAESRGLSAHEQIQRTILNKLFHHDIYRERERVNYAKEHRYQTLFL